MVATLGLKQGESPITGRSELPENLSKRFVGLVVLEYLMNLFGESPKELFSRIDVLAVLDGVKNDRALFPDAVVTTWAKQGGRKNTPLATSEKLDQPSTPAYS